MVNSIWDNIDINATIAEIQIAKNHPNIIIVVVEGSDDIRLFNPLLCSSVYLINAKTGKTSVEKIVVQFPEKNVIGIRDKDYQKYPICNKVFYCDYCCSEMMIIAQNSCFDRVYSSLYNGKISDPKELRLYCLRRLEFISKLRKCNEENDWGIKFDGIQIGKYYCDNIEKMKEIIIDRLKSINPGNSIFPEAIQTVEKIPKCYDINDYLEITNGHDFLSLLMDVCKKEGYHNLSLDTVKNTVKSTFGINEFKNTSLYYNLKAYQINCNINIVL